MRPTSSLVIAIGTDHRGFAIKNELIKHDQIADYTITWLDHGAYTSERSDYPIFAQMVCHSMIKGEAQFGVLLCGTGIGMAIAANRFNMIYAALVWNEEIAQKSRQDDNANVLVLPADYISSDQAVAMIDAWLAASFKGGRYATRVGMLDVIAK